MKFGYLPLATILHKAKQQVIVEEIFQRALLLRGKYEAHHSRLQISPRNFPGVNSRPDAISKMYNMNNIMHGSLYFY
jgi:hypothetical protein